MAPVCAMDVDVVPPAQVYKEWRLYYYRSVHTCCREAATHTPPLVLSGRRTTDSVGLRASNICATTEQLSRSGRGVLH